MAALLTNKQIRAEGIGRAPPGGALVGVTPGSFGASVTGSHLAILPFR